jgi:hypothetical protein
MAARCWITLFKLGDHVLGHGVCFVFRPVSRFADVELCMDGAAALLDYVSQLVRQELLSSRAGRIVGVPAKENIATGRKGEGVQ